VSTKKPGRSAPKPQVVGFAPGMGLVGVAELMAPLPRPTPPATGKRKAKR
jgi:hypothetical protein